MFVLFFCAKCRGEHRSPVVYPTFVVIQYKRKDRSEKKRSFNKQFSLGCANYASSAKYLIVLTICEV